MLNNIKDIFKPSEPYIIKYIGEAELCMQKIYEETQKYEKSKAFFFKGKNLKIRIKTLKILIEQLYLNFYISGGCGIDYDALFDCIRYLNEVFEERGDYMKFIFFFQDSELLFINEPDQNYHFNTLREIFNDSAEELSIPITGTTYDRPAVPFHVIYHSTKNNVEFMKDLPLLILS